MAAFICVRVSTAVGRLTGKVVYASFPELNSSQLRASICIFSYNLNCLFCYVNLLCIVLLSCSLFLCSYAEDTWDSPVPCCSFVAPLAAGQHRTEIDNSQLIPFLLSFHPLNQRCVTPRPAFLISSHLVALTSVCLSVAANYSHLLFVCAAFDQL